MFHQTSFFAHFRVMLMVQCAFFRIIAEHRSTFEGIGGVKRKLLGTQSMVHKVDKLIVGGLIGSNEKREIGKFGHWNHQLIFGNGSFVLNWDPSGTLD